MKKQFTFLLFMLLFALTSSHVMAQQDVLYIIQDGTDDSDYISNGGSLPGQDRIIKMLESDANFTVSWIKIENSITSGTSPNVTEVGPNNVGGNVIGSPVDFTGFELVIVSENMASSNAIFKAGNALHPDQLTIPVIYDKAYAFRGSSSALATSATSAVVRTQEFSMTVTDATSPIFSGLTVSNGSSIDLLRTTADDKGNDGGAYAIDIVVDLEISATNTLLASVPQITDPTTSLGINYFPSGTQVGTTVDGTFAQDAICMPFSWGAMVKKDGGNITSEFLTIWRNAAYMLTGQTPPTTMYVNPVYNDYEIITETTVYDFRDGSIIPNPSDGYVIQGSPEALAQPQTDRFKTADGVVDYRHAAGDNYHSSTYGLDMKVGSRVNFKPLNTAQSVVKVPLSEFSSLDFQLKLANNNNKAFIKVNGVATSATGTTTYDEILEATATSGQDLNEFITIEYFPKGGQALEFYADATNGGSDIYLPYIEVTYTTLRKKPVKILYLNHANADNASGEASVPGDDAITRMLNADEKFEVTAGTIDGGGAISPADLSPFNLIIVQESVASSSSAFVPDAGPLALKNLTVPVIYCKSEAFRNGKAVTDADAGIANPKTSISVTIDPANQSNPLFNGIDFSESNDIRLFKSGAADNGQSGTTGLKVLNNLDISNAAAGTLATTPEVIDVASSIVINHIPANTQLGENTADKATVDIVAFAFGYGAQVRGDGANISPEALTIWRNAVYMLTGEDVPTTLVENPDYYLPKKVLYVNQVGVGQGAGASAPGDDPVIRMLMADDKFEVTYVETPSDGSLIPALSDFDLVIAQETISSGADAFKPGGTLGIKDVTIPIIYNKSWAFRDGLAVTDADAAVTPTQNVSVTATNTGHPLFKGIDFTGGNDIRIFAEATANDDGSTGGNKGIDVLNGLDFSSAAAGTIATTPEVTDASKSIVINYMPATTQIGEAGTDVLGVNAIALSFSYGAMIMGDGANISPEALTIWRNAAYMLTWGVLEIPDTLVENADFTLSIDKAGEVSNVSSNVRAIGNRIYVSDVKASTEINIYSLSGALVKTIKTNNDTNFNFNSGLWIATVKTFEGTKAVKLLVQ